MRNLIVACAALAATLVLPVNADARVVINVDKTQQRMLVIVNGAPAYAFDVSTGRDNFSTPSGVFAPQRLARSWFSSKYYNSPMPYSIFFHKGYAIHGSNEISKLGGPASHGCIRLHPQNAASLFELVNAAGPENTTIVVTGDSAMASARRRTRDVMFGDPVFHPPHFVSRAPSYEDRSYRRGYVEMDDGWQDWGRPSRRQGRR